MNLVELKVARIRRGVKAKTIADALDKTIDSYIKRENGMVKITLNDALIIAVTLNLDLKEFVEIFYDGILPFRNNNTEEYNFRNTMFPLKEARRRAGYSQEAVALEIGIGTENYNQREKGKIAVTIEESAILSKLYRLTFDEFNVTFYRGNLPFRNNQVMYYDYDNIVPSEEEEINAKESYESCV